MLGITVVSHVPEIAAGVVQLLKQVAGDTPITFAGGTDDNRIGTSMEKITTAFTNNKADTILAFYDLGSAKMNLEMASELTDKEVHIYNVPLIEGAYVAASLVPTGATRTQIEEQLTPLTVKE